jgi:hypothetical protein
LSLKNFAQNWIIAVIFTALHVYLLCNYIIDITYNKFNVIRFKIVKNYNFQPIRNDTKFLLPTINRKE